MFTGKAQKLVIGASLKGKLFSSTAFFFFFFLINVGFVHIDPTADEVCCKI